MEPDYQAFAASINPSAQIAASAKAAAQTQQLIAQRAGGQQAADGDWAGAARTLYGSGDLAGGQAAAGTGASITGAKALAGGDFQGAQTAAAGVGDIAGVANAKSAAVQNAEMIHQYIKRATPLLTSALQTGGPDKLTHALGWIGDELTSSGLVAPQRMQQIQAAAAQDPQGFIANMNATAARNIKFESAGNSTFARDMDTGQIIPGSLITGSTNLKTPAGGEEQAPPVIGGAVPAGGQASGQPSAAPAAAPSGGPVNPNNIGNLRPPGQNGFQQFDSPAAGAVALADQLPKYAARGINTLTKLGAIYAPTGDGANDPAQWAANVGKGAGLDPNAPVDFSDPNVRARLIPAIAQAEGHSAAAARGMAGLQGAPAAPGPGAAPAAAPSMPAPAAPAAQPAPSGFGTSTDTGRQPIRNATEAENEAAGNKGGAGQVQTIGPDAGKYTPTAKAGDVDNSTDDEIQRAAAKANLTGELGPVPRGQAGNAYSLKVKGAMAAQDAANNITPAQRTVIQGTVKAADEARKTMIGQQGQLTAAENNALDNANQIKTLLPAAAAKSGLTTWNDIEQAYNRHTQDPQLAALDTAYRDFQGDYAKVMFSSANGSGGSGTGGDRSDVQEHFDANDSIPVALAKLDQATKGMRFRTTEFANETGRLQNIAESGSVNPSDWKKLPKPFVPVDASAVANVPDAAAALLKSKPGLATDFDAKYGPGTANAILSR